MKIVTSSSCRKFSKRKSLDLGEVLAAGRSVFGGDLVLRIEDMEAVEE
ncbi:hypothetical protein KC19_1G153800 [Ceratodon purpureus]|uniref:Uncharacterized protein n=1 Tax=Ceratodon purpureus TaxID=3225 RepID=A0A8T0J846_CERPU|nr:hypothetical protein KC19_1G153800 [Ceratodon purpureus]